MSAPPYPSRGGSEPQEDCRDYLRTGRCKYGASCKYNHPPNVQSGGGMKGPINPSEPMFPIRPNEPVCQYYMKHGTCKFGQACKFHHPPQSAIPASVVGGKTVLMNVAGKSEGPPLFFNPVVHDPSGSSMVVQLLPQRPNEPDCIFFLKNGRCKYGATCRYHHPIHRQHVQIQSVREPMHGPTLQYVSQTVPSASYPQARNASPHLFVSDGSIAYLAVDGTSGAAGTYQALCAPTSNPNYTAVAPSVSVSQERASSSSSVSSSHETGSSFDHMSSHPDPSSGYYPWPKRSGSGNSLNAYTLEPRQQVVQVGNRVILPQSGSDGSTGSRRHRDASGESDSSPTFYDARPVAPAITGGSRKEPSQQWRTERSASFDHQRRMVLPNEHGNRVEGMLKSTSVPSALAQQEQHVVYQREATRSPMLRPQGRPPVSVQRVQRRGNPSSGHPDDAFSKMTSALLTMMETPEQVAASGATNDSHSPRLSSASSTTSATGRSHVGTPTGQISATTYQDESSMGQVAIPYGHEPLPPPAEQLVKPPPSLQPQAPHHYVVPQVHNDHPPRTEAPQSWSPTWIGSSAIGRQLEDNAQSMPVIQPRPGPESSHASSNVGLFLP